MFKGDKNFVVGLFVSIAIAAFIAFVIWLTGRSGDEEMQRYSLMFGRDVSGLSVGGPVKFMGMNIGSVVQMNLERNEDIQVKVDIEILESTPVDGGTYASLALQGITGVAVVNLASEPGSHPPLEIPPGRDHPVIPVRVTGFSALLSSAPAIMNKLDNLLAQAGKMLGEDNQETIANTLSNLETVTGSLAENRDAIAAIPADLSSTLRDIQATVRQLQDVISQLQPGLNSTIENVNRSSENLVSLTGQIDSLLRDHQYSLDQFMERGLGEAPALMAETREAMRDLEKLMAELKDDPSQLIHRPAANEVEIEP
jgi:phospholipid/cholesterol/gamma-HCH transport system substrate-binding protein